MEPSYKRARYGAWYCSLPGRMFAGRLDVKKVHREINCWTDEEVLAWRDSYASSCSAIAVAGAIFASIGLSSLSLPDLYRTHWSARACLISSMVLGILSVVSATTHQQAVGILIDPLSIRLWLSRGFTKHSEKRPYPHPFTELKLDCSVAKQKSVGLPQWSLNFSVALYFIGFGLYFLFRWVENVGDDVLGSRNIFIVYVVLAIVSLIYAMILWVAQSCDEKQAKEIQQLNDQLLKAQEKQGEHLASVLAAWVEEDPAASTPARPYQDPTRGCWV
ncbi:hypothetical protein BKA64DRAFT_756273 [Cadophora sp. MPI-SDFR-AT-0126]|nr:hypothetical protein BKA64DRAFT_756273 [Leotiomycetes sp. MPI-SDFR-AT-0126]